MDLLAQPHPNRSILWSYEDIFLLRYKDFLRTLGFVVSTRYEETSIAGLSQKVRVLARLYNARQVYHARHYLKALREKLPYAISKFPQEFWDFFSLKTDELDAKPYLLFHYAQELWDEINTR